MEVTWFSMPKEGMTKLQQDQTHVNCGFFDWEGAVHHEYVPPKELNFNGERVSIWEDE